MPLDGPINDEPKNPSLTPTRVVPLTSAFTPASDCRIKWFEFSKDGSRIITQGYFDGNTYFSGVHSDEWRSCYASSATPSYSPGICYDSQTIAAMVSGTINQNGLPDQTQWAALCCPSGMDLFDFKQCQGTISNTISVSSRMSSIASDMSLISGNWSIVKTTSITTTLGNGQPFISIGLTTVGSVAQSLSGEIWAEPVLIYWQKSDLPSFPSKYAAEVAASIGIMSSADSKFSSTSAIEQQHFSGGNARISKGEITGIVVGTIFFALLLGGSILLLLQRRRQKRRLPDLPEMTGHTLGLKRFMAGKWRAEADAKTAPTEIDSRSVRVIPGPPVELEGSQVN